MDKAGCHAGDAGDGDDEATVSLDASYHPFGSLEDSAGDTDSLSLKEFEIDFVQCNETIIGSGGDEHKVAHLLFVYGLRLHTLGIAVEIERAGAVQNKGFDIFPCAADEKQIGYNRGYVGLHAVALDNTPDPRTILNHLRSKPPGFLADCFHCNLWARKTLPPIHSV